MFNTLLGALPLLIFSLLGCSHYLAEFNIEESLNKSAALPVCPFSTEKNCWTESLEQLSKCMEGASSSESPMVLTDTGGVCRTSDLSQTIDFDQSLESFQKKIGQASKENLSFTFHSRGETCFRFQGSSEEFSIDFHNGDFMTLRKNSSGTVQVQCLNGESLTISSSVQKKGCAGAEKPRESYLPNLLFSLETASENGNPFWHLRLLGAGSEPVDLFRCQLHDPLS